MNRLLLRHGAAILSATLLLSSAPGMTAEEVDRRSKTIRAVPESTWQWGFALGGSSWSDLDDIRAANGGGFRSTGLAIEFNAHRKLGELGSAEVLVGADVGFFSTSSDITGLRDDIIQRSMYITPSLRLRYGERGSTRVTLEAGAGWYNTDFAELDCDNVQTIFNPGGNPPFISACDEVDQPFDSDAFGTHLGLRARFRNGMTAGFTAHFADFGDVIGVTPQDGALAGPIFVFSLGAAFGR